MSLNPLEPVSRASRRKSIKQAWSLYWAANIGLVVILATAAWLTLPAMLVALASSLWLAITVGLGASTAGRTGFVWGIGAVLLGPLGAILLPWAVLNALADGTPPSP